MRLFQRVADTGVRRGKDSPSRAVTFRWIKLHVHELIHVLHNQHITIQLDDTVVFFKRKRRELTPAIVEPRVIAEIFVYGWKEVVDVLLGDVTSIEGSMAFFREGVCVQGDQWIFGSVLLE